MRDDLDEDVPRLPLYSPVPQALSDPGGSPIRIQKAAPARQEPGKVATPKPASKQAPAAVQPAAKKNSLFPDLARRVVEAANQPGLDTAIAAIQKGSFDEGLGMLNRQPQQGMDGLLANIEKAFLLERLQRVDEAQAAWKRVSTLGKSLRALSAVALADMHLADAKTAQPSQKNEPTLALKASPKKVSPAKAESPRRPAKPGTVPTKQVANILITDPPAFGSASSTPLEQRPVSARPSKPVAPGPGIRTAPPVQAQAAQASTGSKAAIGASLKSVPSGAISVSKFRHTRYPGTDRFEERRRMQLFLDSRTALLNLKELSYDVVFFDRDPTYPDEVFLSRVAPIDWDVKIEGKGRDAAPVISVPYLIPIGTRADQASGRNLQYHGFCIRIYYKGALQQVYARPLNLPVDSLLPSDFQQVK